MSLRDTYQKELLGRRMENMNTKKASKVKITSLSLSLHILGQLQKQIMILQTKNQEYMMRRINPYILSCPILELLSAISSRLNPQILHGIS
jgi:hypothetical protein